MTITVFQARKILTMNPQQPEATHVAVRDGRVLAVGDLARMQALGEFTLDARYAEQVLMPGLVEGHCHLMAGGLWKFSFVGYHARTSPDGRVWEGCRNFDEVIARLQQADQAMADPEAPLLAWGFDPLFFGTERMTVAHLDQVSTRRPVVVMHASQHLMNVNSAALAGAGITRDTDIEGIARFEGGEPTGELQEFAAMFPVNRLVGNAFRITVSDPESLRMFGQMAQLAGVTTATDLVNDLSDANAEAFAQVTGEPGYPVRLVPAYVNMYGNTTAAQGAERVRSRMQAGNDKLHYGLVKIVADGSIQGFTARLLWPGYHNGAPNGIWILPPAELKTTIREFHAQGLQLHIHTNGDEATEVVLDAIEEALAAHPRWDHRHTLQHCQMANEAQFRRMARLGMCANLFSNHIFYWGDAHREQTMGPDRALRMDACATALRHGVPMAIHSDAPITPLGPLFTAWCAVNRLTSSGQQLGAAECISVPDALYAITMGAAFTLSMDHLVGSIEIGKFADFCVLAEDPLEVAPQALKDVAVLGTVVGGQPLSLPGRA
ncbi:amidohydrolase [Xenophilus arseniciresistens]|uniref:Amidohydrolase n=1 Tax=Xenophilus arseniciresistens TaxID=1283306 RepID=A0AAE3T216_9BURK|nr:amidohydrolase [Xenophilus arseniciresistens]MDA7418581.1 amidohydrolase [Xenophilus arseniciresistens]